MTFDEIYTVQRLWIEEILASKDCLPTHLARESGLSVTTLTRFLNSKRHRSLLSFSSISKLAAHASRPFPFRAMMKYRRMERDRRLLGIVKKAKVKKPNSSE
jgi:hypothetical protein